MSTCRQVKPHKRINSLRRRFKDINQPFMCPHLKLFTRVFIFVRCPNNSINAFSVGSGIGPDTAAPVLLAVSRFYWKTDQESYDQSLQTNTDFLFRHAFPSFKRLIFRLLRKNYRVKPATFCFIVILGCPYSGRPGNSFIAATAAHKSPESSYYSIMLVTTPAPTVRPPSRMAKRRPSSMAMGVISSMVIWTLSPGMTISTPSSSSMTPVTSVVRR